MNKWQFVVLLCACTFLIAGCTSGPDEATNPSPTPNALDTPTEDQTPPPEVRSLPDEHTTVTVTVTEVIDGDTIDIRYKNGTTDTVRLLGIDTPEVNTDVSPDEFEGIPDTVDGQACLRDWGEQASTYLTEQLAGETVEIQFDEAADRRGTFDRLLTYVIVDGRNINYELVTNGYARVFDSRFSLSDQFYAAEADAQAAQTGVWECRSTTTDTPTRPNSDSSLTVADIHANAPGNDHENLNGEYIVFRNEGTEPLDLSGWTVKDEADHTYQFPTGFTLAPSEEVTLYSGSGSDTDTELYWGSEGAIWNNSGDTIFVYDESGSVILERSYD